LYIGYSHARVNARYKEYYKQFRGLPSVGMEEADGGAAPTRIKRRNMRLPNILIATTVL